MIMPALPCAHDWRPLFPPGTGSDVTGGREYRSCPECQAVAIWEAPYWEILPFAEAHRFKVVAAYLRPAADRDRPDQGAG